VAREPECRAAAAAGLARPAHVSWGTVSSAAGDGGPAPIGRPLEDEEGLLLAAPQMPPATAIRDRCCSEFFAICCHSPVPQETSATSAIRSASQASLAN